MGYLDASQLFGKQDHAKVAGLDLTLFEANNQKEQGLGVVHGVVLHWTAGNYTQIWDDYHYNVVYDPTHKQAHVVKTLKTTDKGSHIWGRNTGLIGITMSCMVDKQHPVTAEQVEAVSQLVAEICAWKRIDPKGTYHTDGKASNESRIWTTGESLEAAVIADHHWYALKDGYSNARWDIGDYYKIVKSKAQANYEHLKAGTAQFQYKEIIK